jgi:hypothetical protein
LRPNLLTELTPAVVLKKLRKKLPTVTGAWPLPPQMAVRSKPNSRFSVGRKLIFSTCTQGLPGLITLARSGFRPPGLAGLGM